MPVEHPLSGPPRVQYIDPNEEREEESDESEQTELSEDYDDEIESDSSAEDDIPPLLKVRPASAMARASNAYEPIPRGPIAARPPSAMARLHPPPPVPTPIPTPDPSPPSTPLATPRPDMWEEAGYEKPEVLPRNTSLQRTLHHEPLLAAHVVTVKLSAADCITRCAAAGCIAIAQAGYQQCE